MIKDRVALGRRYAVGTDEDSKINFLHLEQPPLPHDNILFRLAVQNVYPTGVDTSTDVRLTVAYIPYTLMHFRDCLPFTKPLSSAKHMTPQF